jgi:hypothetical protein
MYPYPTHVGYAAFCPCPTQDPCRFPVESFLA